MRRQPHEEHRLPEKELLIVNPFLYPISLSPPGRGKGEPRLLGPPISRDVDENVNLLVMPIYYRKC